jgi:very-short-patch-repair endonuclease
VNPDLAVATLAESQHGVVTRAQARARGFSEDAIYWRLKTGRWECLYPGVYRLAGSERTHEQELLSACMAGGPTAVASHRSAARLLGLPVRSGQVEITILEARRARLNGVKVHRAARLDRVDRDRVDGIPVTSVARTLIDLSGALGRAGLEAALDHALSQRLVPLSYLKSRLEALGTQGRQGAGLLAGLIAVRLDGPRPAMAFERRLQAALARAGLAAAREHEVRLPNGRTRRIDFAFPEYKLAVEADSYRYHFDLDDWSEDRTRNNELVALGWRILPVTYRHLTRNPRAVTEQIRRALEADGGQSGGPMTASAAPS